MKKITAIIMALALCLAFASCSKKSDGEQTTQDISTTVQETETQPQTEPETEEQTTAVPETQAPTAAAQAQKATQKPTQKATQAATKAPQATSTVQTTAAPAPSAVKGFESEMLELCNQQRRANGKADLALNSTLCANASVRAEEISRDNCFSHTRPDGTMCFTAVTVDYMTCGENIAYGTRTVSATVTAWMNSPGHKANILADDFTQAGFGCYEVNGVRYWVQLFIG